ncbi:HAMP domain-containing sensor histidine kinase [Actinokineospora auranticolor]|uniref:histidine kinase n=1 Tax=Actinokineospora auranticolor TaxID=155976 RepID=A0A2S6H0R5_9PSEU|nr:HAMP domain-containing sensor histidine kinase [Actinokineospora auranticolor]PPK71063.1 two-component system sensor histidine kinase MprB [Actinokineospora auranticolor]
MTGERRLLLRTRIALGTACVMALAIAAISVVVWLTTRHNLRAQVDDTLLGRLPPPAAPPPPRPDFHRLCAGGDPQSFMRDIQLLRADGTTCAPSRADAVVTEPGDGDGGADRLRDGVTRSGARVRVLLHPVGNGEVLLLSRDLVEIENTLTNLGNVLIVVSVLGAAMVAATGALLTRGALAPMARLTSAAEEIARTEDLTTPVAVSGRDEVGRLGRAFTRMTTALAESRRRQRALVDDAAHELRTPLTSLRTNIDLLVRSERTGRPLVPAQRARVLDRIQAQAREFGDLVSELVVLARDERELSAEPVAVAEVIDRAVQRAAVRAGDRVLDVRVRPWTVVGDAVALERSVLNLLDNAVKFTPEDTRITVRSAPGWLTVADEGPGVPPTDRPLVFGRFWRSPHARALPGSGLGLAIVSDTITAHGGTVRFEDPPNGTGALVRVELPTAT